LPFFRQFYFAALGYANSLHSLIYQGCPHQEQEDSQRCQELLGVLRIPKVFQVCRGQIPADPVALVAQVVAGCIMADPVVLVAQVVADFVLAALVALVAQVVADFVLAALVALVAQVVADFMLAALVALVAQVVADFMLGMDPDLEVPEEENPVGEVNSPHLISNLKIAANRYLAKKEVVVAKEATI